MVERTKRKLVSLAITVSIVISLLALAQPTTAALVTVSGPDEVVRPDTFAVQTTATLRSNERVDVRNFRLTVGPVDGDEEVTVVFDGDGSVLAVYPERGTIDRGAIRATLLRKTIEIVADHPTDDVGYGYGYGSGDRQFVFEIRLDSKAFADGRYVIGVGVDADDDADVVTTSETTVIVRNPASESPGDGPADEHRPALPSEVPHDARTVLRWLSRLLEPAFGFAGPATLLGG